MRLLRDGDGTETHLGLHAFQRKFFFDDRDLGRYRVARCTRRAGKTTGAVRKILITLLMNPNVVVLFVAQTRQIIQDTVLPELLMTIDAYGLPFKFHETKMRLSHTRGRGRCLFRGAADKKNINKLRGLGTGGRFVLAMLDECGSWGTEFEQLVMSVISPGLRDHGGELLLFGSPGEYPEGLFYEASEGLRPNWVKIEWTLQDNPFLKPEARDMENIRKEENLDETDPVYIREWTGKYCLNLKTQMFEYDPAKNSYDGAIADVTGGWEYWGGIDFGWTDETSIVVLAWNMHTREMYAVDSWSASEQTSDMAYQQMVRMKALWNIKRWIGDTGGMGKKDAMNIWTDYGEWIEPADKHGKLDHVAYINAAFRRKHLHVRRHTGLSSELPKVLWNEDKSNAHKKAKDNNAMALLYVWRAANNIAGKRSPERDAVAEHADWPAEETRAKLGITTPQTSHDWYNEWAGRLDGFEPDF